MCVWVGAGGVCARAGQGVQGRDRPRRPRVDLKGKSFQKNMQAAPLPSHQPNQMELAVLTSLEP